MEYSEQRRNSLVARLRAGDHAAELVDSEDLAQESFLAAWQHIGQLKSGRTLNGWMYRIAGNVSRLYWRRHKGSKAVSIGGIDVPDGSEPECDKTGHLEQLGLNVKSERSDHLIVPGLG